MRLASLPPDFNVSDSVAETTCMPAGIVFCVSNFSNACRRSSGVVPVLVAIESSALKFVLAPAPAWIVVPVTSVPGSLRITVVCAAAPATDTVNAIAVNTAARRYPRIDIGRLPARAQPEDTRRPCRGNGSKRQSSCREIGAVRRCAAVKSGDPGIRATGVPRSRGARGYRTGWLSAS